MNPTKVKLARKLLSKKEIKAGTPVFFSKGWSMRADAIKERVARKQGEWCICGAWKQYGVNDNHHCTGYRITC